MQRTKKYLRLIREIGNFTFSTLAVLFSASFSIIAVYMVYSSASWHQELVVLSSKGVDDTGTVVDVEFRRHKGFTTFGGAFEYSVPYVTVAFSSQQGSMYELTTEGVCDQALGEPAESVAKSCIGKRVPVVYNPNNPSQAHIGAASDIDPERAKERSIRFWAVVIMFSLMGTGSSLVYMSESIFRFRNIR